MKFEKDITENITITVSQYDYFRDLESRMRLITRRVKMIDPNKTYFGSEALTMLCLEPEEEEEKA